MISLKDDVILHFFLLLNERTKLVELLCQALLRAVVHVTTFSVLAAHKL